jgi:antiviral helicase SKI2
LRGDHFCHAAGVTVLPFLPHPTPSISQNAGDIEDPAPQHSAPPAATATTPAAAAAASSVAPAAVPAPAPKLAGPSVAAKAARSQGAAIFDGLWMLGAEAEAEEGSPSEAGSEDDLADSEAEAADLEGGDRLSALEQAAGGSGAGRQDRDGQRRSDGAEEPEGGEGAGDGLDELLSSAPAASASAGGAKAAVAPSPSKRRRGDLEFAVRGGIDDPGAAWWALQRKGMAIAYPFELDSFQREAVLHLEQGHSVREGGLLGLFEFG